jgi:hypothetical protein
MLSRATIEAEVALDEGSRANLDGRHPFSVVGCVVLLDGDRDKARELITARSIPKWKDAKPADVEAVLSVFETTRARDLVRIFDRSEGGVGKMKETIEGAIRREADVLEHAHLFLDKSRTFDPSAEGLYHLMLFATASPLLHKAAVEEIVRSLPKKYVDLVDVRFYGGDRPVRRASVASRSGPGCVRTLRRD